MPPTPYKINKITRPLSHGCTKASACTLKAILKFDGLESSNCVYNEKVAALLGQTLHVSIAQGVLTCTGDGHAYASLEIGSHDIALPNLSRSRIKKAADIYPNEIASLTAFDIFIGNWDRRGNVKACTQTSQIPVFSGFDHSHALLDIEKTPKNSLSRLKSNDLIVKFHPFYGRLDIKLFTNWIARISDIDDIYIHECCTFGKIFRAVTPETQKSLAKALIWRKNNLKDIVAKHIDNITSLP